METKAGQPPAYETTTESRADAPPIAPQMGYPKSVPGMLKIAEIVLCILVLICSSVVYWSHLGGGWVSFVAGSALFTTLIFFLLHFLNVIPRLPGPWTLIEFLYYCVYALFWALAAIVAAIRAPYHSAIGATAFFTFAALVVYIMDTYIMYRAYKTQPATAMTSTTTTTTTTYETRTQY